MFPTETHVRILHGGRTRGAAPPEDPLTLSIPASALFPVSRRIPPRFVVGDRVDVLRAVRLPTVEEVIGSGVIEDVITHEAGLDSWLYRVSGFPMLRAPRVLRLIERGR